VLARDANEQTRLTFHGVNSPEILRRVRLSVAAWSNLRSALIRKGALEVVTAGVKGRSAVYRIPPFAPAILHRISEESEDGTTDLHRSDEAPEPILHPTDEESGRFFIDPMTPTPLSAPQLLSPPRTNLASVGAPAAPRERRGSIDNDTPAQPVIDAYAAALGRPVPKSTQTKILDHAQRLIADGYPAPWLADRAREMAPKGWTDLEQHAARSTVPLPGASRAAASGLPEWCGECGVDSAGAAKFNPRLRVIYDGNRPIHCHKCHPIMIERSA
jgi:hypothetical protein